MFWISAFCVSLVGSILPGLAAELYVVAAATIVDRSAVAPLILVTAAGQVLGKLFIYLPAAGSGVLAAAGLELERAQRAVRRAGHCVPALVFVSALASVPPYYATSIACGALRSGVVWFVVAGYAGRVLRAAALIHFARLIGELAR